MVELTHMFCALLLWWLFFWVLPCWVVPLGITIDLCHWFPVQWDWTVWQAQHKFAVTQLVTCAVGFWCPGSVAVTDDGWTAPIWAVVSHLIISVIQPSVTSSAGGWYASWFWANSWTKASWFWNQWPCFDLQTVFFSFELLTLCLPHKEWHIKPHIFLVEKISNGDESVCSWSFSLQVPDQIITTSMTFRDSTHWTNVWLISMWCSYLDRFIACNQFDSPSAPRRRRTTSKPEQKCWFFHRKVADKFLHLFLLHWILNHWNLLTLSCRLLCFCCVACSEKFWILRVMWRKSLVFVKNFTCWSLLWTSPTHILTQALWYQQIQHVRPSKHMFLRTHTHMHTCTRRHTHTYTQKTHCTYKCREHDAWSSSWREEPPTMGQR